MTNNEKALELVQKCLDDWPYAATRVFDIMKRLEQVKILLKSDPQWISVTDRLPDKQPDEYLVVNAHNVETAICLDNRWITPRRVTKITHWMPLPEPPEEVKQDG